MPNLEQEDNNFRKDEIASLTDEIAFRPFIDRLRRLPKLKHPNKEGSKHTLLAKIRNNSSSTR